MTDDQTRNETDPIVDDLITEDEPASVGPETDAADVADAPTEVAEPAAEDGSEVATVVDEPSPADDAPPADVAPPDGAAQKGSGRDGRPPLVTLLAVLTAVLFVTTVLFGLMAFAPRIAPIKSGPTKLAAKAQEEDGLREIARRFAANFVSIGYDSIDEDLDRITKDTTSTFATKIRDTMERVRKAFVDRKASSTGEALDAAVTSHADDSAIVQVLIRRTNTNVGTKGPKTGNQVVNVTLVKTDDGWKVDDMSQLGADAG